MEDQQIRTNQRLGTHDEMLRKQNNLIKWNAELIRHGLDNHDEAMRPFKFTFGKVMVWVLWNRGKLKEAEKLENQYAARFSILFLPKKKKSK